MLQCVNESNILPVDLHVVVSNKISALRKALHNCFSLDKRQKLKVYNYV